MTKTYIKPETVTIKVEAQQIMAGSPELTGNPAETGDEKEYGDAKGFSFELEEVDEEY